MEQRKREDEEDEDKLGRREETAEPAILLLWVHCSVALVFGMLLLRTLL